MRVLVTGANGQLGAYVVPALTRAGHDVIAWAGRSTVDLTDDGAVREAFVAAAPEVIIHAAALAKPAVAFADPQAAHAINVTATRRLVDLADRIAVRLIAVSTDMVFDGEHAPYCENHPTAPASVYGKTKLAGENEVLDVARNMIIRVSLLYGPSRTGTPGLFDQQLAAMRRGEPVRLFEDEWRTPLAIDDAAAGLVAACESDASGLYHLGGPTRMSRLEMGEQLAEIVGADASCLHPCSRLSIETDEPRPRDLSLEGSRWMARFPHVRPRTFAEAARAFVDM